ncbi:glycosyltransferase family 2 protein [Amycolatopsis pigmentata]|uniref:Glycosyltransferase family 2 protein n=1 Tax=Amycolatopsis pigmentata TaxID=450801 RepID=A0ABW5G414_9PSEU
MTKASPTVSVIIPNYNYARALRPCLESVLAQTYDNLEILLVDDCSTDDSASVAAELGIRIIRTPYNMGAPAARNLGAGQASGEVLLFVDSDVALNPDAVVNAVRLLESSPDIGAVCGNYDPVPLFRDSLVEEYRCLQQYYWLAEDEGTITTSYTAILAISADLFAAVGGFDPRLRHTENAEFGHRLSRTHQVRLTSAVRGRHDYDDSLRVVMSKVFTRARLHIPLYLRRPELSGGFSSGPRAWGSMATLAALFSIPLPVLFGPLFAAVPLSLLAIAIGCDVPMYRFVLRRRGPGFLGYFLAMHGLVNATVGLAALAGGVQWLSSSSFRRMYDRAPTPPAPGQAVEHR